MILRSGFHILFLLSATLYNAQSRVNISTTDDIAGLYTHLVKSLDSSVRVIGLGEQWHGDGHTFVVKSNISSRFCQEKGAVIFFESSPFGCMQAQGSGSRKDMVDLGINKVWQSSKQTDTIKEQLLKGTIKYAGIDVQLTDWYSKHQLAQYFASCVSPLKLLSEKDISALNDMVSRLCAEGYKFHFQDGEKVFWNNCFQVIENNSSRFAPMEYYIITNVKRFAYLVELYANGKSDFVRCNRVRDSLMALNCLYLLDTVYKKEPVILWAASFHLVKHYDLDYGKKDARMKSLGDFLFEKIGTKYKVFTFTSAEGENAAYNERRASKIPAPKRGSIEWYAFNTGFPYAFFEFGNGGVVVKKCMPAGYEYLQSDDFTKHFDGGFYIRRMFRSDSAN